MKNNKESIKQQLQKLNGHKSFVIWLTGYSGAGKSTVANTTQQQLIEEGLRVIVLDGDELRNSICSDLGFSQKDRAENLRRVAEIARICSDNGNIVICSFISPLHTHRKQAAMILKEKYYEVFINSSLRECERRDPKGLYKKARSGEIQEFTGISSLYEPPQNPNLVLNTEKEDITQSVNKMKDFIKELLNK